MDFNYQILTKLTISQQILLDTSEPNIIQIGEKIYKVKARVNFRL